MTNSNLASEADSSPRILVVDDTDVNQKIARLMLQRAGYRVDVAADGQEAVQAHQHHPYDLILMDIQMPIMDGLEATRKIREMELEAQSSMLKGNRSEELSASSLELSARAQRVPIIAMTGNVGAGGFDETLYPGMNDCVGKPLQLEMLQSVVQKWISRKESAPAIEDPVTPPLTVERKQEDNQSPLDLDRAVEEFMGQKEILLSVLQKFLTSAGSQIDRIRQAVKEADYGAIGSNAHAIKGAAANLTADKLANLAADLEQAADQQQTDSCIELSDQLEQEFFNLKTYIRQIPKCDTPSVGPSDIAPTPGPDVIIAS